MRFRWITLISVLALALVACSGDDPELSTESTIVTGPTDAADPEATTTTPAGGPAPSTTLLGQPVTGFEVVAEIPNENGVAQYIVIPEGAYTDVDLANFVIDLLEANPDLYGAEIFGSAEAAQSFVVPAAERTDAQNAAIESDWYVTLTGRDRIDYHGPFAEFPGGAIGS